MECKIFYSWQSDLPSQTNEQFIEAVLKNVVQRLKDDSSLDVNPILDRDIANVPGSPDVVATILAKIEQSDIFVGDVSIINKKQSGNSAAAKKIRLTSNPNVLVEFGYALKALGPDRIVLVNNLAFGKHEELPFDFRHKHVLGYNLTSNSFGEQNEEQRQSLEKQLDQKLRQIIITLNKSSSLTLTFCDQAITAIEKSQPNQKIQIQHFIDRAMADLEKMAPPFPKVEGNELDVLIKCIDQSADLVLDFTRLFSAAVSGDSIELPFWIYKTTFNRLINKYYLPIGFNGLFSYTRMRFYQFIGHELFISLIAFLIEAEKFEVVSNILDEALFAENTYYAGSTNVSYTYISMAGESSREINYPMLESIGEKLGQRHSEGELAILMPSISLAEADYFLTLRKDSRWHSISDHFLQPPKFLIKSFKKKYAQKLLKSLAVDSMDEFKSFLSLQSDRGSLLRWRFNFDANKIGTE